MIKISRLLAACLLLCLLLCSLGTAFSESYTVYLEDDADLLTSSEEESLKEIMRSILPYGHALFYTTSDPSASDVESSARAYLNRKTGSSSAVLFMIDMKHRKLCVWSNGEILKTITSAEGDNITDNVYRSASRGDYFTCAKEAFSQIHTLLAGGVIARPMKLICNLLLAAGIAALILRWILRRYEYIPPAPKEKVQRKLAKKEDPSDGEASVSETEGLYEVSVTGADLLKRIETDISSDSGGGGGGGGGGGSHGF